MKQSSQRTAFHSKSSKSKARGAIALLLLFLVFVGTLLIGMSRLATRVESPLENLFEGAVVPVTITLVGDVMFDRGVRASITKNFAGDYGALFAEAPYLNEADITFANLEGTASEDVSPRTGSRFSFRMDPKGLTAMRDAGFDIVSFANNHVGDYSTKGFLATIANLEEVGIRFAGAGRQKSDVTTPTTIIVRGTKVGFLAATDVGPDWLRATETDPGILLASDPDLARIITDAKAQVDVLVVSFHFGNEYSPANKRQELLAHTAVDAGADIVVGHHPHVMERVEEYNGKLIFYSLGNFIFDQYFSPHTMQGMVAQVSIDPASKVLSHELFVSPLSRQYIPQTLIPFDDSMLVTKTFTP